MKRVFQVLALAVTSTALFVACNKKGSDNSGVQPVAPPTQTCVMGQVQPAGFYCNNGVLIQDPAYIGGNLLSNAIMGSSFDSFSGQVAVNATNGTIDPNQLQGIAYYSGPISMTGTLNISNSNYFCGAPAGSYSVHGTGNIYAGIINNFTMNLAGPSSMTIQIYSAVLYSNRLGITSSLLTINGMPCGMFTSQ